MPVRVLLIDQSRLLTTALAACIRIEPDLVVVGEHLPDDPQLALAVSRGRPDVVVLAEGALRTAQPLVSRPGTVVVLLAAEDDVGSAVDAARSGAAGWLAASAGSREVIEAVRAAAAGWAYYPSRHLGAILRELRQDAQRARQSTDPLEILTPREREVLQHLVEGLSSSEIASRSHVSPHTVRSHTHNLFRKLDVRTRLEAVRVARNLGLQPVRSSPDGHAEFIGDLPHPS